MRSKQKINVISFTCILFLLVICGCAVNLYSNYGEIRPNKEVTQAFDNYVVNTDLNYYITGSDICPNAIIGVDKEYTLVSDLWKKTEFTACTLKELVQFMKDEAFQYHEELFGFDILDDKGNDIGDWYSILSARTSVKMIGDKKVIIYTPPLDIYKEDGEDVLRRVKE
jgi:hypothetical protein